MPRAALKHRRVCFVTGTRAEFGLMSSVLQAIRAHPRLTLQLIATGMHLDSRYGKPLSAITAADLRPDATVPWPPSTDPVEIAASTGRAIASIARELDHLQTDIIIVTGDRVEAFAAASAAHLSRRLLAHVHGGDRALGQLDDSLRHAITKLAHVHFPATAASARRIMRLGEDRRRIHRVGSPGNDGITKMAVDWPALGSRYPALAPRRYALLLLHPADRNAAQERRRAKTLIRTTLAAGFPHLVALYPNNDPGSQGIIRGLSEFESDPRITTLRDLPRPEFLGLLRDAAVLVGNSSSGIIEAAAFSTPVLDVGPRQAGRERSRNVAHCGYDAAAIRKALARVWGAARPRRRAVRNVYGGDGAGRRIADILATLDLANAAAGKLITY